MSLINQMLQDLEKRRASGAERGALPNQVRVLPRDESRSKLWWSICIGAALVAITLLAWQMNSRRAVNSLPAMAQTQAQQSPLTMRAPGAPASRLALDLEQVPPRAARAPAPPAASIARKAAAPVITASVVEAEPALAAPVASAMANIAPAKSTPAEMPKPAAPAAAVSGASTATVKTAAAAPRVIEAGPAAKLPAAPANAQIDKRAQVLSPSQQAENDYREAANFLNQGRLADAQEGFRRALQNNPAHVSARQGLFGLLLDAKKNAEAEQLLQQGLALNPNQPGFAMALSSLQYERGDVSGAIDTMQKSAPAAQSSPDYLARLAGLLQRQSRHREAIDNYQAALRLAPGSGVWLMGLGISLQASNRNNEAQEAFRRAKSSNTLNPELTAFVDQRLKQLQ